MKKKLKPLVNAIRNLIFKKHNYLQIYLPSQPSTSFNDKLKEVLRRLKYFGLDNDITYTHKILPKQYLDYSLIGFVDATDFSEKSFSLKKGEVFNFDFENYVVEGWEYHKLLSILHKEEVSKGVREGKKKLEELTESLKNSYQKAYILGTGPSLEKANEENWNDGIRIVSNTIVKDTELWDYINPHFIVAGDGIYHYGIAQFAQKFRKDLRNCLARTNTYFVMPAIFYPFCLKEFSEFKDRLIPIPFGNKTIFTTDLTKEYRLPLVGNVLPLLLLPLACTLSKNVNLWGFDGRSPDDKLFWKNSSRHFYTDDVDELKNLHNGFFNTLVPKDSPESYVKNVHGDSLDHALTIAENRGYKFTMMHFSYTETLSKRSQKASK
ncbi:hypothetical protein EZ428_05380 [Pedobacter frigiditerrae]|uniref:Uncharacterized protein n=1 Tax=Pedobacter frigiditerrae TaxID=2530452 RepID=A0A4R0N362_9SPHI|nr:hypothetical protein [Pedobacter frigiditerrae]TCC94210.1 hypothetical protein EZ428_05380 [Pedobacter frigiditerrae]